MARKSDNRYMYILSSIKTGIIYGVYTNMSIAEIQRDKYRANIVNKYDLDVYIQQVKVNQDQK